MNNNREKEAVNAYLKFLQGKGATSGTLYKRSLFLDRLTANLAGKTQERANYGLALDIAIATVSLIDKYDCQNTAREFYPFWMNDIKAITAFELHYGFDIQSIKWMPLPTSLDTLTKSIDTKTFNKNETASLNNYASALRSRDADSLVVETRVKLAKVILIRLRDAPTQNNKTYRMAVDIILPLFQVHEIRQLFLSVVREFYYFWNKGTTSQKV